MAAYSEIIFPVWSLDYNWSMESNEQEKDYQEQLDPELYQVARNKGTERPYSGKYLSSKEEGVFKCAVCGNQLFSSDTKFDTKVAGLMGWPSFKDALPGSVKFEKDTSLGMNRTEVLCAKCNSHLGHVFDDDEETDTGKHYCINSVCLKLEPSKK